MCWPMNSKQAFSTVLAIAVSHSECARALTFENVCQAPRCVTRDCAQAKGFCGRRCCAVRARQPLTADSRGLEPRSGLDPGVQNVLGAEACAFSCRFNGAACPPELLLGSNHESALDAVLAPADAILLAALCLTSLGLAHLPAANAGRRARGRVTGRVARERGRRTHAGPSHLLREYKLIRVSSGIS